MILNPQAKLLHHGERLLEWTETGRTRPVLVEIAPAGSCNASCPWCFFKDNRGGFIKREVMVEAIREMSILGVKAINWTGGGEPTLHPNFAEFVETANKLGIKQGLFTNGYLEIPHQEAFTWIRISITDRWLEGIKIPKVPFGICLNQIEVFIEEDLTRACLRARKIGASYFQVRPALNQPATTYKIPEYLKEYETERFKVLLTEYKFEDYNKERGYDDCYGYHFCLSIDWNGKVGTCLYMMNNKNFVFGDLNTKNLVNIWSEIPKKIKVVSDCQQCCKNHMINKALYEAKKAEQIEFL
jgi:hypothetical protein